MRGDDQVGSTNWFMLVAMHSIAAGILHLRRMQSAEPFKRSTQDDPDPEL